MRKTAFFFILFLSGCSTPAKNYPLSDHFDGDTFHNPGKDHKLKSIFDVLKWQIYGKKTPYPKKVPLKKFPFETLRPEEKLKVTLINHATFLIQLQNLTMLTDPVYSERTSPVSFMGPKRVKAPGLPFEKLPPIDVVVISHNHYDHLDLKTLKKLQKKFTPVFLVPLGNKKLLESEKIENVRELDWWEKVSVKEATITLTPAQHWSARSPWDKNETLWGSFFIEHKDVKIYHAGDTGLGPHFKMISERLGEPDVAMLPIGAYKPRWFMKDHHMNPEEAVTAHQELKAKTSIGMHFGTWQLSDEGIDDPVLDLRSAQKKRKVKKEDFLVLEQGESFTLHHNTSYHSTP